jgi:MOSC domain-containing protein YiiM
MLETMLLESINVGRPEAISHRSKSFVTGICKKPVKDTVSVDASGMNGDAIVDVQNHGGTDQAVYAYSADDYDWWSKESGHDFSPGLFGENLTIRGLPSDMNVGDRLLIGEVVIEATAPRIPCSTFAARMKDSEFGLAFRAAERPGVYFRVLNGGEVSVGSTVTFVPDQTSKVSILELFRFNYALNHDAITLREYLDAPIAIRFRNKIESKLKALESRSG